MEPTFHPHLKEPYKIPMMFTILTEKSGHRRQKGEGGGCGEKGTGTRMEKVRVRCRKFNLRE